MQLFLTLAALVAVSAAAPQQQFGYEKTSMLDAHRSDFARSSLLAPQSVGLVKTTEVRHIVQDPTLVLRKEKQWSVDPSARALRPAGAMPKEAEAEVVEQTMDMPEPGRYAYHFKTANGIEMVEQAEPAGESEKVQGSYMWTSPDGRNFKIEYVADEMGFHPVGEHLPVAPEIPVAIQRSLEWNAAHPDEEARRWESPNEKYVPKPLIA